MPTTQVNPYLDGNFAPVRQEITAETLQVIGELPPDLSGMFLRNGPNPQWSPIGQYHWFDGDGMLHGVRIHNGQASYRNRYVRTTGWQIEHEAGKAIWSGLLEPLDRIAPLKEIPEILDRVRQIPKIITKITADLALETPIARDAITQPETMAHIGTPVAHSCPSCGGPLWQIGDIPYFAIGVI